MSIAKLAQTNKEYANLLEMRTDMQEQLDIVELLIQKKEDDFLLDERICKEDEKDEEYETLVAQIKALRKADPNRTWTSIADTLSLSKHELTRIRRIYKNIQNREAYINRMSNQDQPASAL